MKAGLKAAAAASAWILLITCLLIIKYAGTSAPAFSAAVVTEKAEVSGSEHLTFDISMPVISGLGDKAFESELNGSIERQVSLAREAAVKAADEHWLRTEEEGFEPWPYAFYAEYDIKSNEGILSLKVTTFLYTGGPGIPYSICYNADTERSRLLSLSGLFKDDSYKEKINTIILGEMAENTERYVPKRIYGRVKRNAVLYKRRKAVYHICQVRGSFGRCGRAGVYDTGGGDKRTIERGV